MNRLGHLTDKQTSDDNERLQNLANFQTTVLKHALSFPAVKRVVYSTCSVHEVENECVVFEVLKQFHSDFHLDPVLPAITSRGRTHVFREADKCLRLSPSEDLTNGFFVACFEKGESECAPVSGAQKSYMDKNTEAETSIEVTVKFPTREDVLEQEIDDEKGPVKNTTKKYKSNKVNKKSVRSVDSGEFEPAIQFPSRNEENYSERMEKSSESTLPIPKKRKFNEKRKHYERALELGKLPDEVKSMKTLSHVSSIGGKGVVASLGPTGGSTNLSKKSKKKKKRKGKPITSV